jgi:hypothetical protein
MRLFIHGIAQPSMDESAENFDTDYGGDSQPSSPFKKHRTSQPPSIEAAAAAARLVQASVTARASHSNSPAFKSAREPKGDTVLRKNCNSCVLRKVSVLLQQMLHNHVRQPV